MNITVHQFSNLNLINILGTMYCPRVRERVSRPGGGGVISIMLLNYR